MQPVMEVAQMLLVIRMIEQQPAQDMDVGEDCADPVDRSLSHLDRPNSDSFRFCTLAQFSSSTTLGSENGSALRFIFLLVRSSLQSREAAAMMVEEETGFAQVNKKDLLRINEKPMHHNKKR
ncbi:hypothetical protein NE237_002107 [Protea cynaroides]|uniref:Uncharacterized protein n=1 Tax=Protea cynaroides TaxID=273540 RepID=A0A9Q0KVF6_9MAGN|nr:hypothetical protein NE237_002107 [Protea cynaroides]